MPKNTKNVQKMLIKKGFKEEPGKDHHYYVLWIDGKKTSIRTKISRGSYKDISDALLKCMQQQMRLPKREFDGFMECTFSKEDYKNFVIKNNFVGLTKDFSLQ